MIMQLARIEFPTSLPSPWILIVTPFVAIFSYAILCILRRLIDYATWFRDVDGPSNPSWTLGNYADYYKSDISDVNCAWIRQFGGAFRFWAFFGEPRIMLTDPIALDHVLVKQWRMYAKHPDFIRFADSIMGTGLLSSEGEQYKRQKFAVQKGFSASNVRAYHPIFSRHARHLRHKLLRRIDLNQFDDANGVLTDVMKPCARTTLDVLADAGFGQPFGALYSKQSSFGRCTGAYGQERRTTEKDEKTMDESEDDEREHPLPKAYDELIHTVTREGSTNFRLFFDIASWFIPELLWLPFKLKDNPRLKEARAVADKEAAMVIERARQREREKVLDEQNVGKEGHFEWLPEVKDEGRKDERHGSLIGQLIRAQENDVRAANASLTSSTLPTQRKRLTDKARLTEEDVTSQVTTFMLAGHETTSTQLAWMLYSFSKHVDVQRRLRTAVVRKRLELGLLPTSRSWSEKEDDGREEEIEDRGREMTLDEVESIQYLDWCTQEALRLYGPIHTSSRVPIQDDVIPIDPTISPHAPVSGIRVRRGASIVIPVEAMSRDVKLWGDDADSFNPDRWANPDLPFYKRFPGRPGGAAFLFGPRACIGARFTVAEMKTFIATLITDLVFEDCGHSLLRSRWIVTRPYDQTARCEQSPVLLRKSSLADYDDVV